jgi:hypothetical protein
VIATVHLGSAPLEYYLPALHGLGSDSRVSTKEIDEVGYAPLSSEASSPPAPGFRLAARRDIEGLVLFRFLSPLPLTVSVAGLRGHQVTLEQGLPEVLGAASRASA